MLPRQCWVAASPESSPGIAWLCKPVEHVNHHRAQCFFVPTPYIVIPTSALQAKPALGDPKVCRFGASQVQRCKEALDLVQVGIGARQQAAPHGFCTALLLSARGGHPRDDEIRSAVGP